MRVRNGRGSFERCRRRGKAEAFQRKAVDWKEMEFMDSFRRFDRKFMIVLVLGYNGTMLLFYGVCMYCDGIVMVYNGIVMVYNGIVMYVNGIAMY